MVGGVVNAKVSVELVGVTVKPTSVWLLSLGGPALRLVAKLATVCAGAFSLTVGTLASVKVGAR